MCKAVLNTWLFSVENFNHPKRATALFAVNLCCKPFHLKIWCLVEDPDFCIHRDNKPMVHAFSTMMYRYWLREMRYFDCISQVWLTSVTPPVWRCSCWCFTAPRFESVAFFILVQQRADPFSVIFLCHHTSGTSHCLVPLVQFQESCRLATPELLFSPISLRLFWSVSLNFSFLCLSFQWAHFYCFFLVHFDS